MKAPLQPPLDVKLMNIAATALFAAGVVLLLAAVLWWALRHPIFAISGITVQGDVAHNNAVTLRANVAPRLAGNFFTVNLETAREAFEGVPWVRAAVVRREFPNRLRVSLEEHRAVAYWGPESESRLVNNFGEVFEANAGDLEAEELPRLSGPQEQAALVLTMYRSLKPMFEAFDLGAGARGADGARQLAAGAGQRRTGGVGARRAGGSGGAHAALPADADAGDVPLQPATGLAGVGGPAAWRRVCGSVEGRGHDGCRRGEKINGFAGLTGRRTRIWQKSTRTWWWAWTSEPRR